MGVQADKASGPFVFEKLEIQILYKFSVSLFCNAGHKLNFLFFFFFLNYVTQGDMVRGTPVRDL